MSQTGLRFDADYVEDIVGFALESFLSVISFPGQRFTIEPFSRSKERWLGADARLWEHASGFRPFYMQFKRPSAYLSTSKSKIIRDRINVKPIPLKTSPRTLFFPLRDKQSNHKDYQHNVLFRLRDRLRQRNIGDAAYVCPLFLDRAAYRFHLHFAALARWPRFWHGIPWEIASQVISSSSSSQIRLDGIPVLAEHISIPPHALVHDARHSYSFTEDGNDVFFHSPKFLPEGAQRLDKWLSGLADKSSNHVLLSPENSLKELKAVIKGETDDDTLPFPEGLFDGIEPLAAWMLWGDFLKESFSIEQYAVIQWRE